jgi:excisionase family DNA binding protein
MKEKTAMAEQFLTVEQAADRLHVHPITVRRQLRNGVLRGIKRGNLWRVPESALYTSPPAQDTAETTANTLWADMTSGNDEKRSAAIKALAFASEAVSEIVLTRSGEAAARFYASPAGQEEWEEQADWRALDGEPFFDDEEEEESA